MAREHLTEGGRVVIGDLALTRDYLTHTWLSRAAQGMAAPLELLAFDALPTGADARPTRLYVAPAGDAPGSG